MPEQLVWLHLLDHVGQWYKQSCSAGGAREVDSIPGLGRSPGEGNGNPVFLPGEFYGQRSLVLPQCWTQLSVCKHLSILPRKWTTPTNKASRMLSLYLAHSILLPLWNSTNQIYPFNVSNVIWYIWPLFLVPPFTSFVTEANDLNVQSFFFGLEKG